MKLFHGTALFAGLMGLTTATHAENKVSIEQVGTGNRVHIQQKSSDDEEATIIQNEYSDENGNQAVVIQQGKTNVTDFTDQGRFNNVYNSGTVIAPGAGSNNNVQIERVGPASGVPASVTTVP